MNTDDAYKISDKGWIKKRNGYRVRFQRQVNSEIITDYVPGMDDSPWQSDVATWRLAWRLSESKKSDRPDIIAGDLVNICVVDDEGNPVKYYATNRYEVFNSIDNKT